MQKYLTDVRATTRSLKAILAAAICVPAVMVGITAWQDYQQTFKEAERTVANTASLLREHAQKVFESQELVADALEDRLSETGWYRDYTPLDVKAQMRRIADRYDHISSVWLVDNNGDVVFSSQEGTDTFPFTVGDREYFHAVKNGAEYYISAPYIGRRSGKTVFSFAARVERDDAFGGAVLVSTEPSYFQEFYKKIVTNRQHAISLVRQDGLVLIRRPEQPGVNLFLEEQELVSQFKDGAQQTGVVQVASDDGKVRLTAFERVGHYPIYVTYGVDKAELIAAWRANILSYLLFVIPLTGSLIGVVLFALRSAKNEESSAVRLVEESAKREEAEEKFRQMHKLESIGQLTGGIAHDFNNLLQVMVINLEMLSNWHAGDERKLRTITAMKASVDRGVRLTRQLLTFARRQRLKPQVFSLKPRFHEIATMLDNALTKNVTLAVNFPDELWPIRCDLHELELAIINIAVNARDAMPEGGAITVTATNRRIQADTDHLTTGEYVAISISDTGHGMSRDVMQRVCEPFFTTKQVGKGTGLGMSQVYGFVKQSGGNVEIDSEIDKGTMITLYLPRGEAMEEHKPVVQPVNRIVVSTKTGERKHVLMVEDEVIIGEATSMVIAEMGYSVTLVENAQKALDVLSSGAKVDLLFTDVMMPGGMDGLELAKRVRQYHPQIPILVATGYAQASLDAVNANYEIVAKPYSPGLLKEKITALISDPQPASV